MSQFTASSWYSLSTPFLRLAGCWSSLVGSISYPLSSSFKSSAVSPFLKNLVMAVSFINGLRGPFFTSRIKFIKVSACSSKNLTLLILLLFSSASNSSFSFAWSSYKKIFLRLRAFCYFCSVFVSPSFCSSSSSSSTLYLCALRLTAELRAPSPSNFLGSTSLISMDAFSSYEPSILISAPLLISLAGVM